MFSLSQSPVSSIIHSAPNLHCDGGNARDRLYLKILNLHVMEIVARCNVESLNEDGRMHPNLQIDAIKCTLRYLSECCHLVTIL